jgi:hypothetical protein
MDVLSEQIAFHFLDHRIDYGEIHRLHADVQIVFQQRLCLDDLVDARPPWLVFVGVIDIRVRRNGLGHVTSPRCTA